jgi:type IV pilus assembly protein PilM
VRPIASSNRTAIGIDVGGRVVKAAQLRRAKNRWIVDALAAFPRTKPEQSIDAEEVGYVGSVLRRQGFGGSDVVLAIPGDKLLPAILEVPPRTSGAPVDQIARTELSRMHKVPIGSFEMSYWDLPPSLRLRESAQVMAVGCAHKDADELLDVFESAGLNVQALDVRTSAAGRACAPMLAPHPGITAVIDIGWSSIALFILCGGVVIYERTLGEGGAEHLLEVACNKLQLDLAAADRLLATVGLGGDDETEQSDLGSFEEFTCVVARHFDKVVEELRAPFSYTTHQYSEAGVRRVLLIGGGANIPGLPKHLGAALSVEVVAVTPGDIAECTPRMSARSGDAALTSAVGLAQFGEG